MDDSVEWMASVRVSNTITFFSGMRLAIVPVVFVSSLILSDTGDDGVDVDVVVDTSFEEEVGWNSFSPEFSCSVSILRESVLSMADRMECCWI